MLKSFNIFVFTLLFLLLNLMYFIYGDEAVEWMITILYDSGSDFSNKTEKCTDLLPDDKIEAETYEEGIEEMSLEDFIQSIELKDITLAYGTKAYVYQEPWYFDEVCRDKLNFQLTIKSSDMTAVRPEPYGAVRAVGEGISEIAIYDEKGNLLSSSTVAVEGGISVHTKKSVYQLGAVGPGGGFVFYDAGDYSRGWRYLEVAPDYWVQRGYDQQIFWANLIFSEEVLKYAEQYHVADTSPELGKGEENTNKIVKFYGKGRYPASLCSDLVLNGKDDWFLPSAGELEKLMELMKDLTLPINLNYHGRYWSSSLDDVFIAYVAYVEDKHMGKLAILNEACFRPIRAF